MKKFKQPPKKFQPRGLSIVYEDHDIIVVDKVAGLLTVSTDRTREQTAYYLLTDYVRKGNSKSRNRVHIVHRLDRETSGLLVFAKSAEAKEFLQTEWSGFSKKYVAVVCGILPEKEGIITSHLTENRAHKVYSTSDTKLGKYAKTAFRVLKESEAYSLLEIDLLTGRKNQIRVHMADRGCPVVGDKKYGEKQPGIKRLCLHSASLSLLHPFSKESMTFEAKTPTYFASLIQKG